MNALRRMIWTGSLLWAGVAVGQSMKDVSPPVILSQPPAQDMKGQGAGVRGGNVLIGLVVNEKGEPTNVHLVKGLGNGLDQKAIEAVKRYKFRPATKNGAPVPVSLNVEVNFSAF